MAKLTVDVSQIIKIIVVLVSIVGGVVGVGDRLYAKKERIACLETEIKEVHKKVDFMYEAFIEAAKHANIGSGK